MSSETFADSRSDQSCRAASLLEVIAITPEDAVAAESGGADRLEIVREISVGGLTPTLEQFERIRDVVELPLRVMLRTNAEFRVSPSELDRLFEQVSDLRRSGAGEFVFGFLDESRKLDLGTFETLCTAVAPHPWTLHHAFDHAIDRAEAWRSTQSLSGLDCVLSGGVRGDLGQGLQTLCNQASWQTDNVSWLAGGGLILEHVEPLLAAGIRMFHIGRAARHSHSWDRPVSVDAVRRWKRTLCCCNVETSEAPPA